MVEFERERMPVEVVLMGYGCGFGLTASGWWRRNAGFVGEDGEGMGSAPSDMASAGVRFSERAKLIL